MRRLPVFPRCRAPNWRKGIVAVCYQSPLIFQIALAELAPSLSSRRALSRPAVTRRRLPAFARGWLPGFTGPSPSTSLDKGQYSVVGRWSVTPSLSGRNVPVKHDCRQARRATGGLGLGTAMAGPAGRTVRAGSVCQIIRHACHGAAHACQTTPQLCHMDMDLQTCIP